MDEETTELAVDLLVERIMDKDIPLDKRLDLFFKLNKALTESKLTSY